MAGSPPSKNYSRNTQNSPGLPVRGQLPSPSHQSQDESSRNKEVVLVDRVPLGRAEDFTDRFQQPKGCSNTEMNSSRQGNLSRDGELAQGLKPSIPLAEDPGSILSTHMRLTTVCSFSPKRSIALFWLPSVPGTLVPDIYANRIFIHIK